MIFDVKGKCIKLLDDGSGENPLEKYNFGEAANYLFRPCTNEDGTLDEVIGKIWINLTTIANAIYSSLIYFFNFVTGM